MQDHARPHELTLLKIKHIRLKEKYGEGEIPHVALTDYDYNCDDEKKF